MARQLSAADGCRWVVKDPISNEYHFLTDLEMRILRALKGQTLAELIEECSGFLRNEFLSPEGLVAFLADAQQRGLLKSTRKQTKPMALGGLVSPLAIRLPGFNPEGLLDGLYCYFSWIFRPSTQFIGLCIIAFGLLRTLLHADQFIQELPGTASWLTPNQAGALVGVIVIMKVIHELAHGLTCRHFSGRCTEMGLLLLVLIPCLYCDVSDTWLQPRRWTRIAVSAAGMCAELFLASCAAIVWSMTQPGMIHSVCFAMMLVGSIQTVAINGNPLLRYDGYFILSDLLRIPNLATEARLYLATKLKSLLLGTPAVPSRARVASGWFLTTYAIASVLYQLLVLILILYGIYRVFRESNLELFGGIVAGLMVFMLAARVGKSIQQWGLSPMEKRYLSRKPLLFRLGFLLLGITLLLWLPFPHSTLAPCTVEAVEASSVHNSIAGTLLSSTEEGSVVRQGERLATLSNPSLEREINLLRAEEATLQSRLDRALSHRGFSFTVADQIPEIRAAIESARQRRELREEEYSKLALYSPIDGIVFPPRALHPTYSDHPEETAGWSGTPLEAQNIGSFLSAGTEICSIVPTMGRKVVALVSQQKVELIKPGQRVRIFIKNGWNSFLSGVVDSIESSPVEDLPEELVVSGMIAIEQFGPQSGQSVEPTYRVTVKLKEVPPETLPLRSVGLVRVHLQWRSLWDRFQRFFFSL